MWNCQLLPFATAKNPFFACSRRANCDDEATDSTFLATLTYEQRCADAENVLAKAKALLAELDELAAKYRG